MPIFVDPNRRVPYVLEADREKPEDQQVRFLFRIMSAGDYAVFSDSLKWEEDGKAKNFAQWRLDLLRFTLAGWEGPGVPPFETDDDGRPTDLTLSRINFEDRWELCSAADKANKVTDEDAKN